MTPKIIKDIDGKKVLKKLVSTKAYQKRISHGHNMDFRKCDMYSREEKLMILRD